MDSKDVAKIIRKRLKRENVVYLEEGDQLRYLPGAVSRELGWK